MSEPRHRISSFGLEKGDKLAEDYEILRLLGSGWESEVYLVRERGTRIERTAKLFFPQRNKRNSTSTRLARRLFRLRDCPAVVQYHSREVLDFEGTTVVALLSDYIEGVLLNDFVARQPGGRLTPFQGIHLLYALSLGVQAIHAHGEYHGDLHAENVIVKRYGLGFELKFLDLFHWGRTNQANRQHDITECIRLFHTALGGRKHYRHHPRPIKEICCGLRKKDIARKFPSAARLRLTLERLSWDT